MFFGGLRIDRSDSDTFDLVITAIMVLCAVGTAHELRKTRTEA